jgi:hypothetical protein
MRTVPLPSASELWIANPRHHRRGAGYQAELVYGAPPGRADDRPVTYASSAARWSRFQRAMIDALKHRGRETDVAVPPRP